MSSQNRRPPLCLFVVPTIGQPRFHKRCQQLLEMGIEVHIFAFEREYYSFNLFPQKASFTSMGKIQDGRYIARIPALIRAYFLLLSHILKYRNKFDVFLYAFSFDCFYLGKLTGIRKAVLELGDLRISRITSALWALTGRICTAFVLTSRGFAEKLGVKGKQVHFLENKLPPEFLALNRGEFATRPSEGVQVIGVIGFLRYERPLRYLLEFVRRYSDRYKILCYGDGPFRQLFESQDADYVKYFGPFKGTGALADIYRKIDLNFVVYDNTSENVRLALPNKLYESIFFSRPLVCAEHTFLAQEATRRKVGFSVSLESYEDFERDFLNITSDRLSEARQGCSEVSTEDVVEANAAPLRELLKSLHLQSV